jgi:hypothetical protein
MLRKQKPQEITEVFDPSQSDSQLRRAEASPDVRETTGQGHVEICGWHRHIPGAQGRRHVQGPDDLADRSRNTWEGTYELAAIAQAA